VNSFFAVRHRGGLFCFCHVFTSFKSVKLLNDLPFCGKIASKGGEIMEYYPAFICENGHVIQLFSDSCTDRFCTTCGARVISQCPNCNAVIRGSLRGYFGPAPKYTAPAYCKDCGKPYPWTKNAIEATILLLKEERNLADDDRQKLIDILPDAIAEIPRTQLAAIRIRKGIAATGSFVAEGLRQFAIDFGCEFLKKQLDL